MFQIWAVGRRPEHAARQTRRAQGDDRETTGRLREAKGRLKGRERETKLIQPGDAREANLRQL
eukprot:8087292-Alexandrium_andersonii.AAC.1